MVENLVGIELAYINTKHPDFHEAGLIHKALTSGEPTTTDVAIQIPPVQTKPPRDLSRSKENRVCILNKPLKLILSIRSADF